jgi:hypothetical protein
MPGGMALLLVILNCEVSPYQTGFAVKFPSEKSSNTCVLAKFQIQTQINENAIFMSFNKQNMLVLVFKAELDVFLYFCALLYACKYTNFVGSKKI